MPKRSWYVIVVSCLMMVSQSMGQRGKPGESPVPESAAQRDARMNWWRQARFGMFIHWGVYAVPAGVWDGKPVGGGGEWILTQGHIPLAEYEKLPGQFDPVKFDADAWAKTAADAGMKYLVITSKHHDGFCMFDTQATHYNVVQDTPWGKDPLKLLSEACRRHGVRFCVYYSIMDWHNPDQAPAKPDPAKPTFNPTHFVPDKKADYVKYMKTQLKELITQYHPGVIWFDGEWMKGWTADDGRDLYKYLRGLDPDLIINDRTGGYGDFGTPEQHIPPNGLPGKDWETCMTLNNTWGYKSTDTHWKSAKDLLHNLIDVASKGGNYLLNVGPDAQGLIPQPEVDRLKEMGAWLDRNGVSIYGTTASPFAQQFAWGRCTKSVGASHSSPTRLYLHVFDRPADGKLTLPLKSNVTHAYLLLKPSESLAVARDGDGVSISLPKTLEDPIDTVVVAEMK